MEKGLIQVYTGNGKGKTTAAVGQGMRAAGSGNRVYMIQFLKSGHTGEISTLKRLEPDFMLFRFEKQRDFFWKLSEQEKLDLKKEITAAFEFAVASVRDGKCDVLILDEIMGAIGNGLLPAKEVEEFLKSKPESVEIILTGRNVPDSILSLADYVSDINCVKHPFQRGIAARKGIEY